MGGIRRFGADPERVALIVPGQFSTPDIAPLAYTRQALRHRGWTVIEVWWDPPVVLDPLPWVRERVAPILDGESESRMLLVGVTLGTLALPLAAERALPGVWLAPRLAEPAVRDALVTLDDQRVPTMVIGPGRDPNWKWAAVPRDITEVVELPDMDATMEFPGDPIGSIDALREVIQVVSAFVDREI